MKFWHFRFEGRFRRDVPEFGGKGLFSTCLIPVAEHDYALTLLHADLDEYGIDLVEIQESLEVDPDELDADDPDNAKWMEWCAEAKREDTVLLDPWQTFDE